MARNLTKGGWYTPQSDGNKRDRAKDPLVPMDGFPTDTLEGGLGSIKAREMEETKFKLLVLSEGL